MAWIIDVVAPFGKEDVILRQVKERIFAGRLFKALRPSPDGSGLTVSEW